MSGTHVPGTDRRINWDAWELIVAKCTTLYRGIVELPDTSLITLSEYV